MKAKDVQRESEGWASQLDISQDNAKNRKERKLDLHNNIDMWLHWKICEKHKF